MIGLNILDGETIEYKPKVKEKEKTSNICNGEESKSNFVEERKKMLEQNYIEHILEEIRKKQ
jgi:hypothetical protein